MKFQQNGRVKAFLTRPRQFMMCINMMNDAQNGENNNITKPTECNRRVVVKINRK